MNRIQISQQLVFSESNRQYKFRCNAKPRTVFSNFMVQGTVGTIMSDNGEFFNVVVIPSDQVPENYQMGNVIFSPKRGKFNYFDKKCYFCDDI